MFGWPLTGSFGHSATSRGPSRTIRARMTDTFSPQARSAIMRAVKSKNTRPEMLVRSLLHRAGYRFRLHRNDLPGRPDIIFPGRRKIIFVHGCFWHSHSDPACTRARVPKSRADYWIAKLESNAKRDRETAAALEGAGWKSLVIWECELRDLEAVLSRLRAFLDAPNCDGLE